MRVMRKLPVAPLCRRLAVLLETPNQQHPSRVPLSQEGRFAIVTDVEAGCGGRFDCALTNAAEADGEVVWFWRSDAGAKVAKMLTRLAGDGGNQAMVTEKSTYNP